MFERYVAWCLIRCSGKRLALDCRLILVSVRLSVYRLQAGLQGLKRFGKPVQTAT
jgi:hypothetical protein